ncbi:MAG: type II toxin-antitoxin system VapC family toxin [Gammaproteobacteria bacterium]|nr:type II toxin-antitoxin system VapC family toxin [Gammaproteobacteria bacterium]
MARRKPSLSAVVDTNVAAYFLLGTEPYAAPCERFFAALRDGIAPATWEAELGNVLWLATRSGVLPQSEALSRLRLSRRLGITSVPPGDLCQGALLRSVHSGIAVYDSLFVEVAIRSGRRLATFDGALLRAFPDVAARPDDLLEH